MCTVGSELEPTTFWQRLVMTALKRVWLLLFIFTCLFALGAVLQLFR